MNRKCPLGSRFYNFLPPTPTLSLQTPHLLSPTRWCHLANNLKALCEQPKIIQISMSGIAIISMQQGYSRSATSELIFVLGIIQNSTGFYLFLVVQS